MSFFAKNTKPTTKCNTIMIITIFVSLALSILGVKNALLIGFFAALMNIIPYIGPILGASFAVLITLSSNLALPFYDEMLPLLFKVMGVFMVMQLLDPVRAVPDRIFMMLSELRILEAFLITF